MSATRCFELLVCRLRMRGFSLFRLRGGFPDIVFFGGSKKQHKGVWNPLSRKVKHWFPRPVTRAVTLWRVGEEGVVLEELWGAGRRDHSHLCKWKWELTGRLFSLSRVTLGSEAWQDALERRSVCSHLRPLTFPSPRLRAFVH